MFQRTAHRPQSVQKCVFALLEQAPGNLPKQRFSIFALTTHQPPTLDDNNAILRIDRESSVLSICDSTLYDFLEGGSAAGQT